MSVTHTEWTNAQSSATVDVDGHDVEMAYYEEGPADATPVVFMHGVPTWGYLWAKVAPELAGDFRVGGSGTLQGTVVNTGDAPDRLQAADQHERRGDWDG